MKKFSDDYYWAVAQRLKRELDLLPKVNIGFHGNREVVRIPFYENGKRKCRELSLNSKEATELFQSANKRKVLKERINNYTNNIMNLSQFLGCRLIDGRSLISTELVSSLKTDANTYLKTGQYFHNGIQMRSRFELIVAMELDYLGLKYYYEPELTVNGKTYYPDFLVVLEELGCCFIIECFGKADNKNYLYSNIEKISDYFSAGYRVGRDMVFLFGTEKAIPENSDFSREIVETVNNIASHCILRNKVNSVL